MNDRQPPSAAAQALVQGIGMLALMAFGVFVLRGLKIGTIRPAEIVAAIPRYRDALLDAVAPTLAALAAMALIVGFGMLAARHGRTLLAVWWRYRRRWAAVMAREGLVVTAANRVQVPPVRAITAGTNADVITVSLLAGQSLADWDARRSSLAAAFGATASAVRPGDRPADIDLLFSRSHSPSGKPAGKALMPVRPRLLSIPTSAREGGLAATARVWGLQIGWALISDPTTTTFRPKHRVRGSVRWVKYSGSMMAAAR